MNTKRKIWLVNRKVPNANECVRCECKQFTNWFDFAAIVNCVRRVNCKNSNTKERVYIQIPKRMDNTNKQIVNRIDSLVDFYSAVLTAQNVDAESVAIFFCTDLFCGFEMWQGAKAFLWVNFCRVWELNFICKFIARPFGKIRIQSDVSIGLIIPAWTGNGRFSEISGGKSKIDINTWTVEKMSARKRFRSKRIL